MRVVIAHDDELYEAPALVIVLPLEGSVHWTATGEYDSHAQIEHVVARVLGDLADTHPRLADAAATLHDLLLEQTQPAASTSEGRNGP